jgi:hypothetical protein
MKRNEAKKNQASRKLPPQGRSPPRSLAFPRASSDSDALMVEFQLHKNENYIKIK